MKQQSTHCFDNCATPSYDLSSTTTFSSQFQLAVSNTAVNLHKLSVTQYSTHSSMPLHMPRGSNSAPGTLRLRPFTTKTSVGSKQLQALKYQRSCTCSRAHAALQTSKRLPNSLHVLPPSRPTWRKAGTKQPHQSSHTPRAEPTCPSNHEAVTTRATEPSRLWPNRAHLSSHTMTKT